MKKPFFPACFWLVVITVLSVAPGIQLPNFDLFSPDKLAHAFIYCVLVVLVLRGRRKQTGSFPEKNWVAGAFLFAVFFGILMEWVQGAFFPGRFCELDDMIANGFGAAVGVPVFYLTKKPNQTG